MRKKYGIFIVIIIILTAGLTVTLLNKFYSFDFLYNSLIRRDFAVNPRIEVTPDKEYTIRIWYYPFYRTINDGDEKEFFELLEKEVKKVYPDINLLVGEVSFKSGHENLIKSIKEGNPPDIYFNLSDYNLREERLQIAVSPYISNIEKEGFYSVNWNNISHREKLWGWPVLINRQYWIANSGIHLKNTNFTEKIKSLDKNTLILNYTDQTLLKQLLTLTGLDTFKIEKGDMDIDSYRALEEVFHFLYNLKNRDILYNKEKVMPDIFLKEFLEGEKVVVGPVNPYLANFIKKKSAANLKIVNLNNLVQTYKLNIFRQRKYKGDDHTRAVMEVSRIFAEKLSDTLAADMGMLAAYDPDTREPTGQLCKELLEIGPDVNKYWNKKVVPVWIDFWEKGLTPGEVMRNFR
ncbi:MAG: hypothetical protein ACOCQW_04435 [Halanaerobiaceae bacterium]